MLIYVGFVLIIMICIFINKPKSLYTCIFSIDLLCIAMLLFSNVLYIVKLGMYKYSSKLEYQMYRYVTKIPISYFEIKTVVNIALALFFVASVFLFTYDIKTYPHIKKRILKVGIILVGGIFDILYLNSPKFSEKLYLMRYGEKREWGMFWEYSIKGVNMLLLCFCLFACYRVLREVMNTRILFKRRHLGTVLLIRLITSIVVCCIIVFTPIVSIVNSFDIYNFNYGDKNSLLYHSYEIFIIILIIVILISILLCGFDILDNKVFNVKYPDVSKFSLMIGDMRHVFHSYKNTLLSIKAMSEKALIDYGTAQSIEALRDISRQVDSTMKRFTSFLDVYNKIELKYECVNICNCIEEACLRAKIDESVILERKYEHEKALFYGDQEMITDALVNLLNNASEALEKKYGGVKHININIWCEYPWLCVSIRDDGIGISRRQWRKIFAPLYSTKQTYNNWGIGLSHVRNVVKEHSGHIDLYSKLGEYTEFQMILPVEKSSKD